MRTLLLLLLCSSIGYTATKQELCHELEVGTDKYARQVVRETKAEGTASLESIENFCRYAILCAASCGLCDISNESSYGRIMNQVPNVGERCLKVRADLEEKARAQ